MPPLLQRPAGPGQLLSEEHARYFFIQFCEALRYLHAHNVAHRDIKLSNALLSGDDPPRLKLADFGLAKEWEDWEARAAADACKANQNSRRLLPPVTANHCALPLPTWTLPLGPQLGREAPRDSAGEERHHHPGYATVHEPRGHEAAPQASRARGRWCPRQKGASRFERAPCDIRPAGNHIRRCCRWQMIDCAVRKKASAGDDPWSCAATTPSSRTYGQQGSCCSPCCWAASPSRALWTARASERSCRTSSWRSGLGRTGTGTWRASSRRAPCLPNAGTSWAACSGEDKGWGPARHQDLYVRLASAWALRGVV